MDMTCATENDGSQHCSSTHLLSLMHGKIKRKKILHKFVCNVDCGKVVTEIAGKYPVATK